MTVRRSEEVFELPAFERQRATRWALPVLVLGIAAGMAPPAVAEPAPAPACSDPLSGAMTVLPDGTFAVCQGGAWAPVPVPFIPPDHWVSYGDGVQLHGQGRRNPEMMSGPWTGTPLNPTTACGAEQTAVTDAGVGAPQAVNTEPGQPLSFGVEPTMFTIELTGDCLWERIG